MNKKQVDQKDVQQAGEKVAVEKNVASQSDGGAVAAQGTLFKRICNYEIHGMPFYIFAIVTAIVAVAFVTKTYELGTMGSIVILALAGLIIVWIGDRIPLWGKTLGGIMLLTLLGSYLGTNGYIPENYKIGLQTFLLGPDAGFINFYIIMVMCGSLLSIDKKVLTKSLLRYMPTLIGATIGATILALLAGLVAGINLPEVLLEFVSPMMCGGNAAGLLPMKAMRENLLGVSADEWYSRVFVLITFSQIVSIIVAVGFNILGDRVPSLTGNKAVLLRPGKGKEEKMSEQDFTKGYTATPVKMFASLLIMGGIYALATIFAKVILPTIFGIPVSDFIYLIIILVVINVAELLPKDIKANLIILQKSMTRVLTIVIMSGLSFVALDFNELVGMIMDLRTFLMVAAVVLGAALGAFFVGQLVGFYPVDAAITAGCCMANPAGSGDVQVLAAAKRPELLPYAVVSSRIGGAIILLASGFLIGVFYL